MIKKFTIVTNNPMVYNNYKDRYQVDFNEDWTYRNILEEILRLVHKGYIVETHPLSGSVKPNETPYKTVMLSQPKGEKETHMDSLLICEDALEVHDTLQGNKRTPDWKDFVMEDFQTIDYELIKNVINKLM